MGGTTHPYLALQFLTGGQLDPETGPLPLAARLAEVLPRDGQPPVGDAPRAPARGPHRDRHDQLPPLQPQLRVGRPVSPHRRALAVRQARDDGDREQPRGGRGDLRQDARILDRETVGSGEGHDLASDGSAGRRSSGVGAVRAQLPGDGPAGRRRGLSAPPGPGRKPHATAIHAQARPFEGLRERPPRRVTEIVVLLRAVRRKTPEVSSTQRKCAPHATLSLRLPGLPTPKQVTAPVRGGLDSLSMARRRDDTHNRKVSRKRPPPIQRVSGRDGGAERHDPPRHRPQRRRPSGRGRVGAGIAEP